MYCSSSHYAKLAGGPSSGTMVSVPTPGRSGIDESGRRADDVLLARDSTICSNVTPLIRWCFVNPGEQFYLPSTSFGGPEK